MQCRYHPVRNGVTVRHKIEEMGIITKQYLSEKRTVLCRHGSFFFLKKKMRQVYIFHALTKRRKNEVKEW